MYKLRTSNITNELYYNKLEQNPSIKEKYKNVNLQDVIEVILNDEITDNKLLHCLFVLTMCDELKLPGTQSEAALLFFTLVINRAYDKKEINIHISNLSQAKICFDSCGGSFRDLQLLEEDNKVKRFTKFNARHRALFPECNLYWELPVAFYKDGNTQKTIVTIAGSNSPFAFVSIPIISAEKIQIPRSLYLKFFEASINNNRVYADSTDELKNLFDETIIEPVLNILTFMGYTSTYKIECKNDTIDYYYDSELKHLIAQVLNKDAQLEENEENIDRWKQLTYNKYQYLQSEIEYVPTTPINNQIQIFLK